MRPPILKNPTRHPSVIELKKLLRSCGFWEGSQTNVFGPKLEQAVRYFQSTHLGPDGKYLKVDGQVGPKTWWALDNPSGKAQQSNIQAPKNSFQDRFGVFSKERQKFIELAFKEHSLGVKEIPDGSNKGGEVDKYLAGMGAVPWCALFISWLFKQVTGRYPLMKLQAHVQTGINLAKKEGRFIPKGQKGYTPTPGDLAVWSFPKGAGHVSVVVATDENGTKINTIGGNEGNRVKLGLRTLASESSLVGFIRLFDDSPPKDFKKELLKASDSSQMSQSNSR
jgi:peptidoglycan hydrolase-like protein with peptidoglycan-binding domain